MSAVVEVSSAAKGRALVTSRDVQAGEVVVDELPVLLSLYDDAKDLACARCLRAFSRGGVDATNGAAGVGTPVLPCTSCRQVAFCSPACAAAAEREPWVHAPATCRAYAAGLAALPAAEGAATDAAAAAAAATEARSSLRFLIQALALRALALLHHQQQQQTDATVAEGAEKYAQLLSLCVAGGPAATEAAASAARALLPALAAAVGGGQAAAASASALPPEAEVAALLAREQANSFAVEAPPPPPQHQKQTGRRRAPAPRRRLLGGALYARASLVNHECLPNVARFDDFFAVPAGGGGGAAAADAPPLVVQGRLRLVALHALPKGTELALSYTPLRWPAARRRAHCREVYGFDCCCARCALEARADVFAGAARGRGGGAAAADDEDSGEWETDEGEDEDEDGEWATTEAEAEDDGMEAEEEAEAGAEGDGGGAGAPSTTASAAAMDPTYLHLFLLKYVCPRKGCTGGTLAPIAPGQADVMRCNACGGERTEAEFMAELNG